MVDKMGKIVLFRVLVLLLCISQNWAIGKKFECHIALPPRIAKLTSLQKMLIFTYFIKTLT